MLAPAPALALSPQQKSTLEARLRDGSTPQKIALRGRILLLAHQGWANHSIAQQLGISRPTVIALRAAFAAQHMEAVTGIRKRQGKAKVLTAELEQKIVDTTRKSRPGDGSTHGSVRMLARQLGSSRTMVHRVWQRHDIQPHRVEGFQLSNDPQFEEKVRDIVGLYLHPPDRALVLGVDEKSPIQALDRTPPLLPLRPGLPERQTHDYKRYGPTPLFAAFNILNGKLLGTCQARHRARELVGFLNRLEKELPTDLEIHLIIDNYGTHQSAEVQRWLKPGKRSRFKFHFTPTSSSWLNQVERFFALLTSRMIRRGTFGSTSELETAIYQWLAHCNGNPTPFAWKASAEVIFDKVQRCKKLAVTGD